MSYIASSPCEQTLIVNESVLEGTSFLQFSLPELQRCYIMCGYTQIVSYGVQIGTGDAHDLVSMVTACALRIQLFAHEMSQ